MFQACGKGEQRTVCAVGAQDREPERAAIECAEGERLRCPRFSGQGIQ